MSGNIFLSLIVSLALTLVLECCYAVLWKLRRPDMLLVVLVNILTNPVVVLAHHAAAIFWPAGLVVVTLCMELWAVSTEGYLYQSRGGLKRPWLFSLSANLISYAVGCLL